jgi:hypothetical protein
MDVCFEVFDRYYEELGPWPIQLGTALRVQLYAFRDHSPEQSGGRLLLPDLALAPIGVPLSIRRAAPLATAFCGLIGELRTRRVHGPERREEAIVRVECGMPFCLVLRVRRWDNIDIAPVAAPPGMEAWQAARAPRVADVLCGTIELQEIALEAGEISSFPLLDETAPSYPVQGTVSRIERLDLDPASPSFGTLVATEALPEALYWPHRYFVTITN